MAFMQETVGSLRAYFILVGVITGLAAVASFDAGTGLAYTIGSIDAAIALGFLFFGFTLPESLRS